MRPLAVLAVPLLVALLGAAPEPSPESPELPAAARILLVERMGNHRIDVTRLTQAVLVLDHAQTAELAERIASEPRLAEPGNDQAELNSLVPPRFFELQDELRVRALALESAARAGSDDRIATAFGKLTETCVRCHAAYLNAR